MGKATGVFLILAGIGTAALVLPAVDKDAERQLADVVRIATGATIQGAPGPMQTAPAQVAPAQRAAGTQKNPEQSAVAKIKPSQLPNSQPVTPTATASPAGEIVAPSRQRASTSDDKSEPAGKTFSAAMPAEIAASQAQIDTAPTPQPMTRNATTAAAKPSDLQARTGLTRDIQRELKRVGCYDGEVNGEWSPGTRRAMKSFIERVNAALPTDEPDHILRTMVQGHPGNACGKSCPTGQSTSSDGRCLPTAIIAQHNNPNTRTARPTEPVMPRRDKELAAALPLPAPAPIPAPRSLEKAAVPKSTWETTIAMAPPPIEGRMAIGGPAVKPAPAADIVNQPPSVATPSSKLPLLPGAIAALEDDKPELRSPVLPSTERIDSEEQRGVARSKPQNERSVRQAVARRPPPEAFKFPPPSYVGAMQSRVYYQRSERSSFGVHVYDRMTNMR